jgi:molecular chaperone Hsp33
MVDQSDHLITATAGNGIRIYAAVTTKLVEEARRRHDCYPVASAALGRTMTAALLLAANLKTAELLTVRIVGDGPLGEIIADTTAQGTVRGMVGEPHLDLPLNAAGKLDVGKAVGQGNVFVTRFTKLKQPFTGSSALVSGEIAEDITQYLYTSEQTPSSVGLGVLVEPDLSVSAAGGFILQALPDADPSDLAVVEANLTKLSAVTTLIQESQSAKSLIEAACQGLEIRYYAEQPLAFQCTCSRERVEKALISTGTKELNELIEIGEAELVCHFCGEKYQLNREELMALLRQL